MTGFAPLHPSVYVRAELEDRDWSLDDLALRMGPPEDFGINRLTLDFLLVMDPQEGLLVGEETSERLGKAFGTSPDFFLNLDKEWQPAAYARRDAKKAVVPQ